MSKINNEIIKNLLIKHCKSIVHMHQEINYHRFSLILGAGTGYPFGFPSWNELVKRIAEHEKVNGVDLIEEKNNKKEMKLIKSNTSISQLLFHKFKETFKKEFEKKDEPDNYNRFEYEVKSKWKEIVRDCLYQEAPKTTEELLDRDEYLQNFIDIIKTSEVTVNYNFDDTVERLIRKSLTNEEKKKKRGYKTTWSANMKLYPGSNVIYHPNGFLPQEDTENPSPDIVFLEDSFADQLIDSMSGHYSFLANHFAQNTCLLIGLSLKDPSLKHLLRQNAKRHPGHHHYYIVHIDNENDSDQEYQKSVVISNFEVYNLITFFLTSKQISVLGKLLGKDKVDFKEQVLTYRREGTFDVYRYFLTGPVGVGKTTIKEQFKTFGTIDEWIGVRKEGMEKAPSLVSKKEIDDIDQWVAKQIYLKNISLDDKDPGIYIIDRCPLDAFAFKKKENLHEEWLEKAKLINDELKATVNHETSLVHGHIFLLTGEPEIMSNRAKLAFKQIKPEELNVQQELLLKVYAEREKGVTVINIQEKSIEQVTKEIARTIYLENYVPAPMQDWLDKIEKGEISIEDET